MGTIDILNEDSEMKINLQNKVIIVTGASSGIGAAVALEFAKRGARLALIGRNEERLSAILEKAQATGAQASAFFCDVTQKEQVAKTTASILETFSKIDILFYSAGIGLPTFYRTFNSEHIEQIFRTNVFGFLYWTESVLPAMQKQQEGIIAGISSLAAHFYSKRTAGYTSSKAALTNMMAGFRRGLKKYGVRVMTIEPGFVKTPMTADHKHMLLPLDVEIAARKIVHALEKGRRVYRFPKIPAFSARVVSCLPDWILEKV